MTSIDKKTVAVSVIMGAVAGAAVAWGMTICSPRIATVNVQEIVAASPEVLALQAEQKSKIDELSAFVKDANEKISNERNEKTKKELEQKYMSELAAKRAAFEGEYIQKLSEISEDLSKTISKKAKTKGYKVVLSKDAVVSGAKDITEEMVKSIK